MPLAALIKATKAPTKDASPPILGPDGLKRFFVVHGGLFSKDEVSLDDIRQIRRIGRQPDEDPLMRKFYVTVATSSRKLRYFSRRGRISCMDLGLFLTESSFYGLILKYCQAAVPASG